MGADDCEPPGNPMADATLLSKLFFCWLLPFLRTGKKRRLEEADLYRVLPEDRSERLGEKLQRYWDIEVKRAARESRRPKLTNAIVKCYGKPYMVLGMFIFLVEVIKVSQPLLLGKLIKYFEEYDPGDTASLHQALCYAAGISLSTLGLTVLHNLYFYQVRRIGMKMRVAMCHLIYKKALRLGTVAMGKTTTGQIVNLLSNDVSHFDEITVDLHYLWLGPLEALVIILLLWYEIGYSCLAGVAVMVLLMPLQTCFGKLFGLFRSKTAVLTDGRIRTMNEVVSGIRIIKMYAWEKPFSALLTEVRRKEIKQIMRSSYLRGLNMAAFFASSKIIVFVTFTVYTLLGNPISASRVFVTVSLYGAIKLTVTLFFPMAIEGVSETLISIRRLKTFLLLDEIGRYPSAPLTEEKEGRSIEIDNLTCYWDEYLDTPSLQNVSLKVTSGQLLAVVGPVGAGKSSLLSAILRELPHNTGTLKVNGRLMYVAQQPWVFPGTIRSNILFGEELKAQKYQQVLTACALQKDLELLPDGDLTVIGDRGATLSGGQKARLSLARAVYQDADIYLLDDPFSAVDTGVGRHLLEQCICGLLKNKTRILVTHQLQYLKAADQIVVLREGQMIAQGSYDELQRSGRDFVPLLRSDEEQGGSSPVAEGDGLSFLTQKTTCADSSVCSSSSLLPPESHEADQIPGDGVTEETRLKGNVSILIYHKYFTTGCGLLVLLVIALLSVAGEAAYILQDWWLAYWAREQPSNSTVHINTTFNAAHTSTGSDLGFYLGVYAGLTAAVVVLGFARSLVIFNRLVRSAQRLHDSMFNAILRAPVSFFDKNPVGRILNRFSKDVGQVDSILPITFVDFHQLLLQNIGVVAVAASVIPLILIPVVVLLLIFAYLRRFYLHTSRDVKRLESTTRSHVFSHLSSSLQGLWTIRAFRAEERFQKIFDAHQDLHSAAWFLFLVTSRWFAIYLDGICSIFITFTMFGCLLFREGEASYQSSEGPLVHSLSGKTKLFLMRLDLLADGS